MTARYQNVTKQQDLLTTELVQRVKDNEYYNIQQLNKTEKYLLTLLKTHEGSVRRLFVNQLRSLDLLDSIHQNLAELNDEFDRRSGESQSNKGKVQRL